jgi:hypothetical protein
MTPMLLFAAGVMIFVETAEIMREAHDGPKNCVVELCAPSQYLPPDLPEGPALPVRPVSFGPSGYTTPVTGASMSYSSIDWTKLTY